MLSHGSSIFGVVPLVIFAAFRGIPNWRWLAAALAGLLLFYVPWAAFQHYEAPPGNRLLKWQLGGEIAINSEGTLEAIENGYSEQGFAGTVDRKEENFEEMVGWPRTKTEYNSAIEALEAGKPGIAMEKVRWDRFFSLLPFLGFLLISPIVMLIAWLAKKKRDPDEWRFALTCFAFFLIAGRLLGAARVRHPERADDDPRRQPRGAAAGRGRRRRRFALHLSARRRSPWRSSTSSSCSSSTRRRSRRSNRRRATRC